MKSFRGLALGVLLLVSACKVEQTPDPYFDHQSSPEEERGSAVAEVRDRLLAMGQALSRGNAQDALIALAPARDVYVVGPQAGLEVNGAEQIAAVLESLAAQPVPVVTRDVQVSAGPRGNVAWFRALLDAQSRAPGSASVRITGVYVLNEGAWQLVQAHLSVPLTPPLRSSPLEAAEDSVGDE